MRKGRITLIFSVEEPSLSGKYFKVREEQRFEFDDATEASRLDQTMRSMLEQAAASGAAHEVDVR